MVNASNREPVATSAGRRFVIGANVALVVAIVIGLVVVSQLFAYHWPARADMTSTRVNSLSDGTLNVLRNLESEIRIVSCYFKTDMEDEDQPRYRRAVEDLLELYASTNRSKIRTETINPLSDHEKLRKLVADLREHPVFKDEIAAHTARIEEYRTKVDKQMSETVRAELELLSGFGGMQDQSVQRAVAPVEDLFNRWTKDLEKARTEIDTLMPRDNPQDAAAVREIKNVYRDFSKFLNDVANYGKEILKKVPNLPEPYLGFLTKAGERYAGTLKLVDAETAKLNELKPPKLEEVARDLTPNGNPILVLSSVDARVVDFSAVWPPLDENRRGGQAAFKDRAFKGEEKLTSSILRATHKEQTAVIFTRFGGQPLFFGGMMPGQPPAMLSAMKQQLEDANFIVEEWDLKTKDTPPELETTPTRTIYVVFKPAPQDPMSRGQPNQEVPFGETHRQALLKAIGEKGRALFVVGWHPGPPGPGGMMLPIPANYEYADYLINQWGIGVDMSTLLFRVTNTEPGKYNVTSRDWFAFRKVFFGDHPIVKGLAAQPIYLPWCAPLDIASTPPSGVEIRKLITQPKEDGVWGIKNLGKYEEQQNARRFLTREKDDREGPFDLAAAATKGDAKIVVVGARDFAADQVAFATELGMTAEGIVFRSRNPGNVSLMINSLHWLNDNTQYLNVGRPIDAAVLNIPGPSTVRTVQVLTMFIWPVLALAAGGVAWWVRRR